MHTLRRTLALLLVLITLGWAGAVVADDLRLTPAAENAVQVDQGGEDSGWDADQNDSLDSPALIGGFHLNLLCPLPTRPLETEARPLSILPRPPSPPPRLG
jgi:hypothetical protein